MSEEHSYSYRMTSEQYFVLHAMMRLPAVMGYTDPYRGWLRSELEERTQQVIQQLEKKGWISRSSSNGEWEIDSLLAAILAACASDTAVQLYKQRQHEEGYEGYLYITPHLVVERIEELEQNTTMIVVSPLANAALSRDVLRRFFPVLHEDQSAQITQFPRISLPVATWDEWLRLKDEDRHAHIQPLNKQGWPDGLQAALEVPQSSSILATAKSYRRYHGVWQSEQCGYMLVNKMLLNIWNSPASLLITPYNQVRTQAFVDRLFAEAIMQAEEGSHGQDLSNAPTVG